MAMTLLDGGHCGPVCTEQQAVVGIRGPRTLDCQPKLRTNFSAPVVLPKLQAMATPGKGDEPAGEAGKPSLIPSFLLPHLAEEMGRKHDFWSTS